MSVGPPGTLRTRLAIRLQPVWETRGLASSALLPLAWAFGLVNAARRVLYRVGILATKRLPVRVIVVGNLVAGGAGKTPAVIAIAELLRRRGWNPGIVSRGFGRSSRGVLEVDPAADAGLAGDEPVLLARRTGTPVFVGRDRVGAGLALLHAHPEVNLVISDDGLQHLALARDIEVLVFDERGAGNGRLLPAGPLRETLHSRRRPARRKASHPSPSALVLYNAPSATTAMPGFFGVRSLQGAVALEDWCRGEAPSPEALASLRGRTVLAVAGLARPDRFFAMLRAQGLFVSELALPDHYPFAELPWPDTEGDVIVTEKDAVKLVPERRGRTRIWVAALDFEPEDAFNSALLALLAPARAPQDPHGKPTA